MHRKNGSADMRDILNLVENISQYGKTYDGASTPNPYNYGKKPECGDAKSKKISGTVGDQASKGGTVDWYSRNGMFGSSMYEDAGDAGFKVGDVVGLGYDHIDTKPDGEITAVNDGNPTTYTIKIYRRLSSIFNDFARRYGEDGKQSPDGAPDIPNDIRIIQHNPDDTGEIELPHKSSEGPDLDSGSDTYFRLAKDSAKTGAQQTADLASRGAEKYKDGVSGKTGFVVALPNVSNEVPYTNMLYDGRAAIEFMDEEGAEIHGDGIEGVILPGTIIASPGTLKPGEVKYLDPGTAVELKNLSKAGYAEQWENGSEGMRRMLDEIDKITETEQPSEATVNDWFGSELLVKYSLEFLAGKLGNYVFALKDNKTGQQVAKFYTYPDRPYLGYAEFTSEDVNLTDELRNYLESCNYLDVTRVVKDEMTVQVKWGSALGKAMNAIEFVPGENGKLDAELKNQDQEIEEVYIPVGAKKVDTSIKAGDKVAMYKNPDELFGTVIDTYNHQRFAADNKTVVWRIKRVPMFGSGELDDIYYAGGMVKYQEPSEGLGEDDIREFLELTGGKTESVAQTENSGDYGMADGSRIVDGMLWRRKDVAGSDIIAVTHGQAEGDFWIAEHPGLQNDDTGEHRIVVFDGGMSVGDVVMTVRDEEGTVTGNPEFKSLDAAFAHGKNLVSQWQADGTVPDGTPNESFSGETADKLSSKLDNLSAKIDQGRKDFSNRLNWDRRPRTGLSNLVGKGVHEMKYPNEDMDIDIHEGDFVRCAKDKSEILGMVWAAEDPENEGDMPLIAVECDPVGAETAKACGLIEGDSRTDDDSGYVLRNFYAAPEELVFESRDVHKVAWHLLPPGTRIRHNGKSELGEGTIKNLRNWTDSMWGHMSREYIVEWDNPGEGPKEDVIDAIWIKVIDNAPKSANESMRDYLDLVEGMADLGMDESDSPIQRMDYFASKSNPDKVLGIVTDVRSHYEPGDDSGLMIYDVRLHPEAERGENTHLLHGYAEKKDSGWKLFIPFHADKIWLTHDDEFPFVKYTGDDNEWDTAYANI